MNDLQAIERIKRGDQRGLAALVERYQERAVRAAYVITQERASAEDVAQTVFLELRRSLRTFDVQRPFAPWFFRNIVNAALKVVKSHHRLLSLDAVLDETTGETFADLLPDVAALPVETMEKDEMRRVVREALGKLTPEQRAVIVMRYYLDLTAHEISTELHSPPATIRWRLHTAIKRLRGLLLITTEE